MILSESGKGLSEYFGEGSNVPHERLKVGS